MDVGNILTNETYWSIMESYDRDREDPYYYDDDDEGEDYD